MGYKWFVYKDVGDLNQFLQGVDLGYQIKYSSPEIPRKLKKCRQEQIITTSKCLYSVFFISLWSVLSNGSILRCTGILGSCANLW